MRILATMVIFASTTFAAQAACFEDIGCTDGNVFPRQQLRRMSCENLWYARNTIYAENGYCFKTDRAIEMFGNSGCYTHNESRLRLNKFERTNISRIRQTERRKGCG